MMLQLATPPQGVVDMGIALGCALGVPVESWKEGKAIVKDPKLLTVVWHPFPSVFIHC